MGLALCQREITEAHSGSAHAVQRASPAHLDQAVHDHVETAIGFTLPEDHVARLEVEFLRAIGELGQHL